MPTKPFSLGDKVSVSSLTFQECAKVQPSDLSIVMPHGEGVYGFQSRKEGNPFTNAPPTSAIGGTIYFGNGIKQEAFRTLMGVLGVESRYSQRSRKDYAVFVQEAENPKEEGYLTQMRLVSRFALRFGFGALSENDYDKFPEQQISSVDALWTFMEVERERWGTDFLEDKEKGLRGLFGGDGYWAREELSFGFLVENSYHDVYRIWSRAWLVTK